MIVSAGAVAVLAMTAPGALAGPTGRTGPRVPAVTTKVVATKGLDTGTGGPVVRAGQLWLASYVDGLQSVNPHTDAITSHKLSNFGTVALDGPLAVDNAGDLWMDGYNRANRKQLVERYAPSDGKLTVVKFPKECASGGFSTFTISGGAVWLSCVTPGLDYIRRTSSGGWDAFPIPAKYDFTEVDFAPGPSGSVWTTTELNGQTGLLEATSGGAFRYFADPAGETSAFLTGNGKRLVDELYCSDGQGVCFDSVSASGGLVPLATGPETADNTQWNTATIDPSGNFWIVMIGKDDGVKSDTGKFFYEITTKAITHVYPYSVPAKYADSETGLSGVPAFASGSVWSEINNAVDFANGTDINGELSRLTP